VRNYYPFLKLNHQTKVDYMDSYYDKLKKILEDYPDRYSDIGITKLEEISSSYESILNAVRKESDDIKRNTDFHGSELKDINRNISTSRYGKTQKAKREAFSDACRNLKDDIEDLAGKVKTYLSRE